jgi:hypothetical protein
MNDKPKINQKSGVFSPSSGAANWCQLQHIKTFMGLSRQRLREAQVLTLIDTRKIRWAWDIGRKGATRPEVRIWRESLIAYLARESGGGAVPPADDLSLAQVIEAVLPRPAALALRAATVRATDLQRRLLCSRTHLDRLMADGELCRVGAPLPGKTSVILYQSAFEFLKRRSLSA